MEFGVTKYACCTCSVSDVQIYGSASLHIPLILLSMQLCWPTSSVNAAGPLLWKTHHFRPTWGAAQNVQPQILKCSSVANVFSCSVNCTNYNNTYAGMKKWGIHDSMHPAIRFHYHTSSSISTGNKHWLKSAQKTILCKAILVTIMERHF